MRRKLSAPIDGPLKRALRPVARAHAPAFAAVIVVLGCSTPAITADPVWFETIAPAQPATAPHEEPPPEPTPESPPPVAPLPPPPKKTLAPKHHVPKPYIAPDPFPYMLGGDIESVRVAPKIVRERQA